MAEVPSNKPTRVMVRANSMTRRVHSGVVPVAGKIKLTDLIKQALTQTVIDIGQIDAKQKRELNAAVKAGVLDKGKGGPYPNLKTVWACKGFNFVQNRQDSINIMTSIAASEGRLIQN
jgi:hypothetical protein